MTPWTVAHQAPLSMGFFQARVLESGAIALSAMAWLPEVKAIGPLGEITTVCSCCSFVESFLTEMQPGFQLFGSGFKDLLVLGIGQGSVAFYREADLSFLPNYSEFLFILCIKKFPCWLLFCHVPKNVLFY